MISILPTPEDMMDFARLLARVVPDLRQRMYIANKMAKFYNQERLTKDELDEVSALIEREYAKEET